MKRYTIIYGVCTVLFFIGGTCGGLLLSQEEKSEQPEGVDYSSESGRNAPKWLRKRMSDVASHKNGMKKDYRAELKDKESEWARMNPSELRKEYEVLKDDDRFIWSLIEKWVEMYPEDILKFSVDIEKNDLRSHALINVSRLKPELTYQFFRENQEKLYALDTLKYLVQDLAKKDTNSTWSMIQAMPYREQANSLTGFLEGIKDENPAIIAGYLEKINWEEYCKNTRWGVDEKIINLIVDSKFDESKLNLPESTLKAVKDRKLLALIRDDFSAFEEKISTLSKEEKDEFIGKKGRSFLVINDEEIMQNTTPDKLLSFWARRREWNTGWRSVQDGIQGVACLG